MENLSESDSLEEIQVHIIDIQPEYLSLPVPMKIRHRGYIESQILLNPGLDRQIDFSDRT